MYDQSAYGRFKTIANRYPRLSREDEAELGSRYRAGDARAGNTLVNHHLTLVLGLARKFALAGNDISDMFSAGCVGAVEALGKFDQNTGYRFGTYATQHIISRMFSAAFEAKSVLNIALGPATRHVFMRLGEIGAIIENSNSGDDTDPLVDLARVLRSRPDTIKAAYLALTRDGGSNRRYIKFDSDSEVESDVFALDMFPDDESNVEEAMISEQRRTAVRKVVQEVLSKISPRNAEVYASARLSEEETSLAQIARDHQISPERARQIRVGVDARIVAGLKDSVLKDDDVVDRRIERSGIRVKSGRVPTPI